jgi:uncharacterized protein YjiS (DUF1127 family)
MPEASLYLFKRPASHLRRALAPFDIWRRRFRDREALALMDERSLRDVGLTRYDALYEARKPFWRERGLNCEQKRNG